MTARDPESHGMPKRVGAPAQTVLAADRIALNEHGDRGGQPVLGALIFAWFQGGAAGPRARA
jgi:hypothetical protein